MTRKQQVSVALTALAAGLTLPNPGAVRADQPGVVPLARVDSYLQSAMRSRRIPGLSIAVVRDGAVILQRSYGLANVELEAGTSPGSVFELGSLSRQFTAAGVMLLVQDGKIRLGDPIRNHLPELPGSWMSVTVRHLLTHTSGIPSYTNVSGFFTTRGAVMSKKQILDSIAALPMRFVPGEKWSASNSDYFVLGLLIERVSKQTYSRFLAERIFQPLGMAATRVNDYGAVIRNRASGYTLDDNAYLSRTYSTHPSRLFGSGAIVSSVSDMARWEAALAKGELLKPASLAQMWTPTKLFSGASTQYGFGWYVHPSAQWGTIIEHGGGNAGFRPQVVRYTGDKTTVILFTNVDSANPYSIADGVHRIINDTAIAP
jgi:CubicO group peptidase (beta-lactamase class C family)